MADHGLPEAFQVSGDGVADVVTSYMLDQWLNALDSASGVDQVTVVIDACYAGSFISEPGAVSKPGRVIVAATSDQLLAYGRPAGVGVIQRMYFSELFWASLDMNQSVAQAFDEAQKQLQGWMDNQQRPWLDDNGDSVADKRDGGVAARRGLIGPLAFGRPAVDWRTASVSGTLAVAATGASSVRQVLVEVVRPNTIQNGSPGSVAVAQVDQVPMTPTTNDVWAGSYNGFTATGTYRLVAYAWDDNGIPSLPADMTLVVGMDHRVYMPVLSAPAASP